MHTGRATVHVLQCTATTELSQVLSKEIQSIYEWVTGKTKGIIFGSRHGQTNDLQLELNVAQMPIQLNC